MNDYLDNFITFDQNLDVHNNKRKTHAPHVSKTMKTLKSKRCNLVISSFIPASPFFLFSFIIAFSLYIKYITCLENCSSISFAEVFLLLTLLTKKEIYEILFNIVLFIYRRWTFKYI